MTTGGATSLDETHVCQVLIADLLGLCDGFFATAGPAVHGVLIEQFAQVAVRTYRYSVPARLIGRQVRVLLQASQPLVFDGRAPVARHERLPGGRGPPGTGSLPGGVDP